MALALALSLARVSDARQVPVTGSLQPAYNPQATTPPAASPPIFGSNSGIAVSPPPQQLAPATTWGAPATAPAFDAYGQPGLSPSTSPIPNPGSGGGVSIYPPPNAYPWVGADAAAPYSPPPGWTPATPYGTSPGVFGPGTWGNPEPRWGTSGGSWPEAASSWPSQAWARARDQWMPRLFEHPRFRHTYLGGEGDRFLSIHDAELATTVTFPTWLGAQQPLRVSPGFIFHFWGGPDSAVTGVDLPAQAYSAYLAFDVASPQNLNAGYEGNVTVGVYSDFQHVTSDSLRITGVGLGWVRLDPTTTFKIGVEYLDRLDLKLLPAVGLFMMPTQDLKLDFYFPRPKIARRLPNLQNAELWGYFGGEYGGGSWTLERTGGFGDQVDINDIRIFLGVEGMGRRGVTSFFEAGYVFERELTFDSLLAPIELSDTYMLRAGLSF